MYFYTFEHEHWTDYGLIVGDVEVEYEYEKPENPSHYGIKIISSTWLGDGDIEIDDDVILESHYEKMVQKYKDGLSDDSPVWQNNPREE